MDRVAAVVDQILRAVDLRASNGLRTVRVAVPCADVAAVVAATGRAVRRLGFVPVRAAAQLPAEVRRDLAHRHVVVFATEGEWGSVDGDRVTAWIRELTTVSTRAHVIVLIGRPHAGPWMGGASVVRERGPYGDLRTQRAVSCLRRSRHAAARRWLRASLAGARRHRDVAAIAESACRLVRHAVEREDWPAARAAALQALSDVGDWPTRRVLAALAARAMVAIGEFGHAEATVRAVEAEAIARGEDVPGEMRVRRAEVLFWQGRFEESATALLGVTPEDPEVIVWRALNGWARGESGQLATAAGHVAPATAFGRALAAQVCLASGDLAGASRLARVRSPGRTRAPLYDALLQTIEAASVDGPTARAAGTVERFIQQSGARGILRWGLGRSAMNVVTHVSTLLQVVQEADDEYAALRHGCSWVRDCTRADGVGIVTPEGTRVVAGDGLATADLDTAEVRAALGPDRGRTVAEGAHAVVTSPMRYGGATIGYAIVRGSRDATETLGEAATALASACAPALRARLDALALAGASHALVPEILGRSPGILALREAIARSAATPFPVLIEGESGTGKELVARAVHRLSARRDRRFAALNCAALADDLAEAELFGHARGAFTGAVQDRAGLFEEAHRSTLFLDEVTELSPRAQAKLLRVLQEHEIRRLGEHVPRQVDVRVVAATNVPLAEAVGLGRFREDLLFRLAVVRIRLPPLRDRIEDVPLLAHACWRVLVTETGKRALLGPDAIAALCRYRWPGNVRELQNVVAALVVAAPTRGRVSARHVRQALDGAGADADMPLESLDAARAAFERRVIAAALARAGGQRNTAARELGLSRQGLAKAIRRLGLVS